MLTADTPSKMSRLPINSLILKDQEGTTLKSFAVAVKNGDDFTWSKPSDDTITAVVSEDTASIDVTINIAKDGTVTVNKIKDILNPKTGVNDTRGNVWIWVIAAGLILIIAVGVILNLHAWQRKPKNMLNNGSGFPGSFYYAERRQRL